jgi:hypothetical protein
MRFNNGTSLFALAFVMASVLIAPSSAQATTLTPLASPTFALIIRTPLDFKAVENTGKIKSLMRLENSQQEAITITNIGLNTPILNLTGDLDDEVANINIDSALPLTVPGSGGKAGSAQFLISLTWVPTDDSGVDDNDFGKWSKVFFLSGYYTTQGGQHVSVAPTPLVANFSVFDHCPANVICDGGDGSGNGGGVTPIPAAMWLFVTALGGLGMIGYRRTVSSKAD